MGSLSDPCASRVMLEMGVESPAVDKNEPNGINHDKNEPNGINQDKNEPNDINHATRSAQSTGKATSFLLPDRALKDFCGSLQHGPCGSWPQRSFDKGQEVWIAIMELLAWYSKQLFLCNTVCPVLLDDVFFPKGAFIFSVKGKKKRK